MYDDYNKKQATIMAILICICIASFLQWIIFQLFIIGKLGSKAECYAIAQTFVVLIIAPYLGATTIRPNYPSFFASKLTILTPTSIRNLLFGRLFVNQIPLLIWVFLSTAFSFFYTDSPLSRLLLLMFVLGVYCFTAGTFGIWGTRIFRDSIFGTEWTYLILSVFIGSPFLLMPLDRYIQSIQQFIQPILHLNPIIAICHIYDGMDIFRTPLLYELTPITSYDFSYPPWYIISFWYILVCCCCFLWTWRMCKNNKLPQFNK